MSRNLRQESTLHASSGATPSRPSPLSGEGVNFAVVSEIGFVRLCDFFFPLTNSLCQVLRNSNPPESPFTKGGEIELGLITSFLSREITEFQFLVCLQCLTLRDLLFQEHLYCFHLAHNRYSQTRTRMLIDRQAVHASGILFWNIRVREHREFPPTDNLKFW